MPALNEAKTISTVIQSIPNKIDGIDVDVLVVDDGSEDNTKQLALASGAHVVSHIRNKGVGGAFHSAVNFALKHKVDILVSIDADGQFDVNDIPRMIAPIVFQTAHFSIGNRFDAGKPKIMSKLKYRGNALVSSIISFVSKTKIKDASCGFRAYSKECLLNLNLQGNFTYTHETILDLLNKDYAIAQIPVSVIYFEDRVSRVANNVITYGFKTLKIIIKCFKDYRPFPFFFTIALLIMAIGLALGSFVLVHWFSFGKITPYKGLGFIALALCGMAVMVGVLAFIADMLNRIRMNQEKLLYLAKKKHFNEN